MKVKLSGMTSKGNVTFELDDLVELHIIGSNENISGLFRFNQSGALVFDCVYADKTRGFRVDCDGQTLIERHRRADD